MENLTNKETGITYEKLMNSHFLRFPSHSKIVHTIFNPFMVGAIIFVAVMIYLVIADGDWMFAVMVAGICSMFMSMKIALATMQTSGHGVGIIKKGKLSVLGLPSAATGILGIILFLILAIIYVSFAAPEEHFERVQMFGISMLFGFVMSLLSWRFHTYYETWYGSEYDARQEFIQKGYTEEVIKEKIALLKKKGILQ